MPGVLFSEYVEGSASNHAIEIYNATGGPIDLSDYSVSLYRNGSVSPTDTITLSTATGQSTLTAGGIIVLYDPSASTTLINAINSAAISASSSVATFNGDDALALFENGTLVDVIGQIGLDPGSEWPVNAHSTRNHTLIRDGTETEGTTTWGAPYLWNDGNQVLYFENTTVDSFGHLGVHELYCFAAGTLIATPDSEIAVENLQIGDLVQTASGRSAPVNWIGRQTLRKLRHGPHMQPVRIRAGALGDGLPHSDLTVTADHGMVLDGYVVNASALVNGDTIDFVPMDELEDSFIVYHVETEGHDVILANGAPSETFIDAAGRSAFDNYQEYLDLYGTDRIIPELTMPQIGSARRVPQSIRDRLLSSSAVGVADVACVKTLESFDLLHSSG